MLTRIIGICSNFSPMTWSGWLNLMTSAIRISSLIQTFGFESMPMMGCTEWLSLQHSQWGEIMGCMVSAFVLILFLWWSKEDRHQVVISKLVFWPVWTNKTILSYSEFVLWVKIWWSTIEKCFNSFSKWLTKSYQAQSSQAVERISARQFTWWRSKTLSDIDLIIT